MDKSKPKSLYNEVGGHLRLGSLPLQPPFSFKGVNVIILPLKASIYQLSLFCDKYLNLDVDQPFEYRPAIPYVFMMVLDYGSMSSTAAQARNVGWVSQHEVTFTVPLECWKWSGGSRGQGMLEFQDWAGVSPFIFVDDQTSLLTGREVYGWPKVGGKVESLPSLWDRPPTEASSVFRFSTHTFAREYKGEQEAPRLLLEIEADPPPTYSHFPPDLTSPWTPWNAIAQMTSSYFSLVGSALDLSLGLRLRGYQSQRDLPSALAKSERVLDYIRNVSPILRRLSLTEGRSRERSSKAHNDKRSNEAFDEIARTILLRNITIKQFRDSTYPHMACYQAIVESAMGIERVNQYGLLGDINLLRGDCSGGYSVHIHNYPTFPIVDALGLEVDRVERGNNDSKVFILKPIFPYWSSFDLSYGKGKEIFSHNLLDPHRRQDKDENFDFNFAYNTSIGSATQPVVGPFHMPDVTLQIFPLLADNGKLTELVDQYFMQSNASPHESQEGTLEDSKDKSKSPQLTFKPAGNYVYMIVQVTGDEYGTMWSANNNIGWWNNKSVLFCVPVKRYRNGCFDGLAMITPYGFADSGRATATDREVNGRHTLNADIDSPANSWLKESGPIHSRELLNLKTEVFEAVGYGEPATRESLLKLDTADLLSDDDTLGWTKLVEDWAPVLLSELKRKVQIKADIDSAATAKGQPVDMDLLSSLALQVLVNDIPIHWLTLKQYRDAEDPKYACYQALVQTQRTINKIYDLREIHEPVHVYLQRFPSLPIAEVLGLKLKSVMSQGGEVWQIVQPIRPFWMRVSLREDLGEVIAIPSLIRSHTTEGRPLSEYRQEVTWQMDRQYVDNHPPADHTHLFPGSCFADLLANYFAYKYPPENDKGKRETSSARTTRRALWSVESVLRTLIRSKRKDIDKETDYYPGNVGKPLSNMNLEILDKVGDWQVVVENILNYDYIFRAQWDDDHDEKIEENKSRRNDDNILVQSYSFGPLSRVFAKISGSESSHRRTAPEWLRKLLGTLSDISLELEADYYVASNSTKDDQN